MASWRQSIPVRSVVEVSKVLRLLLRPKLRLRVAQGSHVEPQHPKANPGELSPIRKLFGKPGIPHVGGRSRQSGCLFPRNCGERGLHGTGLCPANHRNVLHDRKHEPAPQGDPGESSGGTVLRKLVHERRFGHAELSWHAAFDSTPRCPWSEHRRSLPIPPCACWARAGNCRESIDGQRAGISPSALVWIACYPASRVTSALFRYSRTHMATGTPSLNT